MAEKYKNKSANPLMLFSRILVALAWLQTANASQQLDGTVVGVSDGDTITVLDSSKRQHRIRLHQIDAPEKRQDFGMKSKQSLSDLIFSKPVRVEIATIDKYGREVGKVWINGTDANLEQIKRGMAMVYRQYASDPAYFAAEEKARSARIGLWSQPNPMPPWEFRHGGKGHSEGSVSTKPEPHFSASASCSTKRYCGQMSSCEEAKFYLNQCGVKSLDRDGDGVSCESLCR